MPEALRPRAWAPQASRSEGCGLGPPEIDNYTPHCLVTSLCAPQVGKTLAGKVSPQQAKLEC